MLACDEAFKAETIENAFKNSRIRPFNPNIFTKADYAPSRVSSTQAHTPSTYPQAVFGNQPYTGTPLPHNDNDFPDKDPCDGDISDGEGAGDANGGGSVGEVWFETDLNSVWTKPKLSFRFPVWEIFAQIKWFGFRFRPSQIS